MVRIATRNVWNTAGDRERRREVLRHALDGTSVCYRDAGESARPGQAGPTFPPDDPHCVNPGWPFRRIDYVLVRCGDSGGPSLLIRSCDRIFDEPVDTASDHYGLLAELQPAVTG